MGDHLCWEYSNFLVDPGLEEVTNEAKSSNNLINVYVSWEVLSIELEDIKTIHTTVPADHHQRKID
jgi:hypothetical protein